MAITLTFPPGGALVTGGTGRLGEGIVRQLAKADVPLVFTYLGNEDAAKALEAELKGEGHKVIAIRMVAGDDTSVQAALDRVVTEYGRLHTVAVGSGVPVAFAKMADFSVEDVLEFVRGDAIGYFRLFKAAIEIMRNSGGGSIVAVTTVANKRVIEFDGISPFSKGSVDAMIRQFAFEEAEHKIRVNGIAIGWIDRGTIDQIDAILPKKGGGKPSTQMEFFRAIFDQLSALVRIPRLGTLEEGGNLAAFLASDQAAFLTGQIVAFDGGATL